MKDFVNAGLLIVLLASSLVQAETRYVRFQTDGAKAYGIIKGDRVYELDGDYFSNPKKTGKNYSVNDVELLLPLDPLKISKVLGTAVNTRRPGLELPENAHPRWFAKFPTSLNPDGAGVMLPPEANNLNYEGELVVVIGKKASRVSKEEALDYVFGYTVGNDFSENTWYGERKGRLEPSRLISKGSDTWACLGSIIVAGIDYKNRNVKTVLNGQVVQNGNTNELIQDVPELISYISRYITLMPGDLIYTGTVLFEKDARRKMQIGDKLEVTIEGIGSVANHIVAM